VSAVAWLCACVACDSHGPIVCAFVCDRTMRAVFQHLKKTGHAAAKTDVSKGKR
jgi:hypothetical protein